MDARVCVCVSVGGGGGVMPPTKFLFGGIRPPCSPTPPPMNFQLELEFQYLQTFEYSISVSIKWLLGNNSNIFFLKYDCPIQVSDKSY